MFISFCAKLLKYTYKNFYYKFKQAYNINKEQPYLLISLGTNCYPKTILTRHKLKTTREYGEKTLPFDLAWFHHSKDITTFINNQFSDFLDNLKYMEEIGCWDNEERINFSHEKDFGPDDKTDLINMYKQRIENFQKYISDERPILFVQFLADPNVGEDIENLYEVLSRIRQNKPFQLLVIDTIDIVKTTNNVINVLKLNIPYKDYNLYDKSFYKSPLGKLFEKTIIKKCQNIIKEKFNINPYSYI